MHLLLIVAYIQIWFELRIAAASPLPVTKMCRSERLVYLMPDDFKSDACARCYHYFRGPDIFHFKYEYTDKIGTLRNPFLNRTQYLDPANISQDLSRTFIHQEYSDKWMACCRAAWRCCDDMLRHPVHPSETLHCPRTWDGWQCWQDTPAGYVARQPCPDHIYFKGSPPSCTKYVYKECTSNGTWYRNLDFREQTNYSTCSNMDERRKFQNFHISTYIISIIFIIPALIIFLAFKQLQVPRITLHKNLLASLLLHAVCVLLLKTLVVADELNRPPHYIGVMQRNGPLCKILLLLTKYFRMTTYMWMFCEGLYLQILIAATFAEQKNLLMYYLIGWVFPVVPITVYGIIRATVEDKSCWVHPVEAYELINYIPGLLGLSVNLLFLCNIIRILVTKLRANIVNEPSQYRKAVRATLVLVPLFGLHFIFVFYRPVTGKCGLYQAYRYFEFAMDGFQGFLVALVFCFFNGEVQYLIKRTYQRLKLTHEFRSRKNSASTRRLSTTLTSMNDSQHHNGHGHRGKLDHKCKNHAHELPRTHS